MKDIFLLDMDETLLNFSKAEEENFSQTMRACGIEPNGALYARFHAINDALWKRLELGELTRARLLVLRFEMLFEEFRVAADAAHAAAFYYKNFEDVCVPYEGAAEFLKALKARGRIYIVTNGGAQIQRRHISDAGFAPYLSGVFISDEVGYNKPSKEYAEFVKAHIEGFDCARAVWLGDSLTSDMVCAKNAGVSFVLYAPHGAPQGYEGKLATCYKEALEVLKE